jgi:electron transport complex protein RnfG
MVRALVGVGLVCGLLIVLADQGTRERIAANRLHARQSAVLQVLPGAERSATFRLGERGAERVPDDTTGEDLVFAGFTGTGALVGIAVEASAMGYQDVVKLIYGVSLDEQAIIGMRVLESRETPGLGDRVDTDPSFRANFEALDVTVVDGRLAHEIEAVKHGTKSKPWQVDCITGATITSKAVAEALRTSTNEVVPRLRGATFEEEAQ